MNWRYTLYKRKLYHQFQWKYDVCLYRRILNSYLHDYRRNTARYCGSSNHSHWIWNSEYTSWIYVCGCMSNLDRYSRWIRSYSLSNFRISRYKCTLKLYSHLLTYGCSWKYWIYYSYCECSHRKYSSDYSYWIWSYYSTIWIWIY